MRLQLEIKNTDNVGALTDEDIVHMEEILEALITSGGLTGVKGGRTIIHFDGKGDFQGVEHQHMTWRRRK